MKDLNLMLRDEIGTPEKLAKEIEELYERGAMPSNSDLRIGYYFHIDPASLEMYPVCALGAVFLNHGCDFDDSEDWLADNSKPIDQLIDVDIIGDRLAGALIAAQNHNDAGAPWNVVAEVAREEGRK